MTAGNADDLADELQMLLRTDRRALDFMTDGVLDGIWYSSLEEPGREWISPRYLSLFGYTAAEIPDPAGWWRSIVFPEDIRIIDEAFARAIESPDYRYETIVRFRHKEGRTVWVHCLAHVIRDDDGRPLRLLGCHVDITRLMELEQLDRFGTELATSRALIKSIFDSVSDGLLSLAPFSRDGHLLDLVVTAANGAAERLLSGNAPSLVGAVLTRIIPELGAEDIFPQLAETLASGRPFQAEIGPMPETGLWFLVRAQRIADSGLTLTLTNITAAKIREINLSKSNAALKQFSAIVSHDLQSPLRHIGLFTEMLGAMIDDADTEAHAIAGRIRDNVTRLQRMIASLFDYSSVAYAEIRAAPVDLNRVVSETLHLLEGDVTHAHASIDVADLPTIMGDHDLIQRLFQNLVANALKYRRQDVPPRITVAVERERRSWLITVTDNGIGIDPRFAERIFEVFTRLHNDSTYVGLGIGLALCKQIAESHKGRLWLDTDYRDGARFCLSLPVA